MLRPLSDYKDLSVILGEMGIYLSKGDITEPDILCPSLFSGAWPVDKLHFLEVQF